MTVSELSRLWNSTLTPIVGPGEAKAITREAFEHFLNMTPVDVALHSHREPEQFTLQRLDEALRRIAGGTPVQYVTGQAWFHGLRLTVTPRVLIPRRETSQLVDIIAERMGSRPDLCVLDLCTGSGAIAIALSRALKFASVTAVDNSPAALEVARLNARNLKCNICFLEADVLKPDQLPAQTFDIIVSNPPYIPENEKAEVDPGVLKFEPNDALFVPSDNPLQFYAAITPYAASHLNAGGSLFFEINPHFATQVESLLATAGFHDTLIINDMFNRKRFALATL